MVKLSSKDEEVVAESIDVFEYLCVVLLRYVQYSSFGASCYCACNLCYGACRCSAGEYELVVFWELLFYVVYLFLNVFGVIVVKWFWLPFALGFCGECCSYVKQAVLYVCQGCLNVRVVGCLCGD